MSRGAPARFDEDRAQHTDGERQSDGGREERRRRLRGRSVPAQDPPGERDRDGSDTCSGGREHHQRCRSTPASDRDHGVGDGRAGRQRGGDGQCRLRTQQPGERGGRIRTCLEASRLPDRVESGQHDDRRGQGRRTDHPPGPSLPASPAQRDPGCADDGDRPCAREDRLNTIGKGEYLRRDRARDDRRDDRGPDRRYCAARRKQPCVDREQHDDGELHGDDPRRRGVGHRAESAEHRRGGRQRRERGDDRGRTAVRHRGEGTWDPRTVGHGCDRTGALG